jgi:hypothetical protein
MTLGEEIVIMNSAIDAEIYERRRKVKIEGTRETVTATAFIRILPPLDPISGHGCLDVLNQDQRPTAPGLEKRRLCR